MISINKIDGTLNNIIGIIRNYGISEIYIKNIKSHKFNESEICTVCNISLNSIRSCLAYLFDFPRIENEEILSCSETVIKNILE